jgi:NarL family two-component system response regulator LiaR
MIRVLVVDDHDFVRESVVIALAGVRGIEVVGSCASGLEAVNRVDEVRPDVILMDLCMPVLDGVEATRQIVARRPDARVVILTASFDGRQVNAARAAGAFDVVFKNAQISEVVAAIRRAAMPPRLGHRAPL